MELQENGEDGARDLLGREREGEEEGERDYIAFYPSGERRRDREKCSRCVVGLWVERCSAGIH
jgi:hypothetical protein